MSKSVQKIEARKLRSEGESIKKIARQLRVSVGSVSAWCRNVELSSAQKKALDDNARNPYYGGRGIYLRRLKKKIDSKTEKLIQEAITEAIRGRTTIVIAHRLSTIKNADKIAVIENGRFMEEGTLSELLDKKGKFFEYWQEQKFYE